jgi:hypothetical protein
MGRPPLTEDQVRDKVLAYCERYHVSPGPAGFPPFPKGKRETRQHREWLTVYRAHQRSRLRAAAVGSKGAEAASSHLVCPICSQRLPGDLAVPYARRAARATRATLLHPACAELARLAETLGPTAVASVGPFLWTKRPPRTRGQRPADR